MGIRTFIGIKQRQGLQETCLFIKGCTPCVEIHFLNPTSRATPQLDSPPQSIQKNKQKQETVFH